MKKFTSLFVFWTGLIFAILPDIVFSQGEDLLHHVPKIGLALSGGGARGIAHIGVLRALEENHIPIDYIAGTSMGAVIGALYASGYSTNRLEEIIRSIDWQAIFSPQPDRPLIPLSHRLDEPQTIFQVGFDFWNIYLPEAALSDYRINRMLIKYLARPNFEAERNFNNLPIPFRAVAADLKTGQRVTLSQGSLSRALRASMSIPLAFPPVAYGDSLLVDGGIVDNIPVDVVRQMDADVVIAVDVTSPPLEPTGYRDVLGIANQLTDLLSKAKNVAYYQPADLIIRPDLRKHGFADYSHFDSLMAWGYQAALVKLDSLKKIVGQRRNQNKINQTNHPCPRFENRFITNINIEGNRYLQKELIQRDFGLQLNEPFYLEKALTGMDVVYASGFFKSCWLDFEQDGDSGIKVFLYVLEAERRTAELGLSYNDEDKTKGILFIQNRNLFGWGERAQLMVFSSDLGTGLHLRIQGDRLFGTHFGYSLQAKISREKPKIFQNNTYINRAEFDRQGISFTTNYQIRRASLFQIGIKLEQVEIGERLGVNFIPGTNQLRAFQAAFIWDDLDDIYSPTHGVNFSSSFERNFFDLGASQNFWRAKIMVLNALPILIRHILETYVFAGFSGGIVPVHEQFRIGGPILMPGFHRDELWGNQAVAVGIGYNFLIKPKFRLRMRILAGNVWERRSDITLWDFHLGTGLGLQYTTPVGPIAMDLGITDSGEIKYYFTAGFQ